MSLEVPNPTPCSPPGPVWQGKRSPEAAETPSSTAPPPRPAQTGTLGREGWRERRFGKTSGGLVLETPTPPIPPPTPSAGRGRGGISPPPGLAARSLLPRREPGPSGRARPGAGGIGCRLQLAVRRTVAGCPGGQLLIPRPPSPGRAAMASPEPRRGGDGAAEAAR